MCASSEWMAGKVLALILLGLVAWQVAAGEDEDLLDDGGLVFDGDTIDSPPTGILDGLKTTLDHRHERVPGDISREQTSLRFEYENAFSEGWFMRLDTRYRYFWRQDELARQRGERYGRTKWQRAWVQYSRGSCAYKAGRQTLIWSDVEGTFVNDVITPFDYTEQLLTDYGNVRLAQDMVVTDCFVGNHKLQWFITPQAETSVYQHERLIVTLQPGTPPIDMGVDADEEWGFRYQWRGEGYDVSLMYARLYPNDPQLVLREGRPVARITPFDMLGVGASLAIGRVLLKAEAAWKNDQTIALTDDESNRVDVALGIEYTTTGNHFFNAGLQVTHFDSAQVDPRDVQLMTVGWRKSWLNDVVTMSLLGNCASSPRFASVTVLAEYQWTDYWNVSLALGLADVDEQTLFTSVLPYEKSATLGVKYEF